MDETHYFPSRRHGEISEHYLGRLKFVEKLHRTFPRLKSGEVDSLSCMWSYMRFLHCRYHAGAESKILAVDPNVFDRQTSLFSPHNAPNAEPATRTRSDKDEVRIDVFPCGFSLFALTRDSSSWNPAVVLHDSAQRQKLPISFHFSNEGGQWLCRCVSEELIIAHAVGPTKQAAKSHVSELIVRALQNRGCPVKAREDAVACSWASPVDVKSAACQPIPDSNTGSKLLRKMGWDGSSGMGKNSQGIQGPITLVNNCARMGLGSLAVDVDSKRRIQALLDDFVINCNVTSVRVDSMSKEERKYLHSLARNYPSVRHRSYGKAEQRALYLEKVYT